MNTEASIKRAGILLEQSRFQQADKELRSALTYEPQNILAMQMLISCQLGLDKNQEALQLSQSLLGLQPDDSYNLYIHSVVLLNLDRGKEAEPFIREAISQEPYEAAFYEILSRIYLSRKEWEDTLRYANEGLAIDPGHLGCLNMRTMSLTKLNRKQEAIQTIEDVLQQDPDNAYSHTNVGWAKLEQGDHKSAKVHFAEALRLEPSLEHARSGMLEAVKAGNIVYRLFLAFSFWVAKHQSQSQWAIVIGSWLGFRVLRGLAKSYPILMPLVIVVGILFYMTWIIEPLFNLFMRLDKHAKYLLTEKEMEGANWVGAFLAVAIVSAIASLVIREDLLLISLFAGTMVIPVASLYSADTPKQKRIIKPYTFALAGVGVTGLVLVFLGYEAALTLGSLYLLGIFAFGWIVNGLRIR